VNLAERSISVTTGRCAVVIELCGLPGSGKTTLAHALLDRLRESGMLAEAVDGPVSAAAPRHRRLPRKAILVGRAFVTHPRAQAHAARLVGSGQPSNRDMLAMSVRWSVAQQLLDQARRSGSGAAVLEEGLLQALWSAGLRTRSASVPDLVGLASTTARPDVVVHLDVPVELALERLRSRTSQHSRVQQLGRAEQLAEMQRGDALLRGLLTEWRRRGFGQVIEVNAAAHSSGQADVPVAVLKRLRAGVRR